MFVYVIAAEIANTPETKVTPIGRSAAHAKMGLGGNLTDLVNKLRELGVATSSVIIWTAPVSSCWALPANAKVQPSAPSRTQNGSTSETSVRYQRVPQGKH